MSSFPGSPRLLKGGIALLDPGNGTLQQILPLVLQIALHPLSFLGLEEAPDVPLPHSLHLGLDLRKPRNADDGYVPSGECPHERGPLFFTPRGFFLCGFFGGVVSRRVA